MIGAKNFPLKNPFIFFNIVTSIEQPYNSRNNKKKRPFAQAFYNNIFLIRGILLKTNITTREINDAHKKLVK